MRLRRLGGLAGLTAATVMAGVLGSATLSGASSHREAPYIATDPQADATDLYAFVSPDSPNTVTIVANYVPLQVPPAGPNFYKFGDDVLYQINIDNNGDAVDDVTYQFRFRSEINPSNAFGGNTFLYNTGQLTAANCNLNTAGGCPNLNQRQYYSITQTTSGASTDPRGGTLLGQDIPVAPANVGPKSFPNYESIASQAVRTLSGGEKVFAGPRDDPFFVDLGKTFDLLNFGGTPKDYLAGLNVHSIVLQVPFTKVTASHANPTSASDPNAIIGVRTTSHRQSVRVLRIQDPNAKAGPSRSSGNWVQVSRLDLPLINEVIIPLKDKDRWNSSKPINDGQFLDYVTGNAPGSFAGPDPAGAAPHLGALIQLVLGVPVPAAPRTDLVEALLLGVPGLNRPANVVASSQLRLNLAIPVAASPNKQGVLAGDIQGFPNGRRLTDDVVDIELAVVAGCLYPNLAPGAFAASCTLGDGVNTNDKAFTAGFPYLASPHAYE